jgi:putative endonuclease
MYKPHELGKEGEQEAEEYLIREGYKIIERNFSCKTGEIDLIALDKKEIVFIEVKTRMGIEYGLPSEAVTKLKLKHILRTAQYYLYIRNLEDEFVRIDVIEIYAYRQKNRINHIKQVI